MLSSPSPVPSGPISADPTSPVPRPPSLEARDGAPPSSEPRLAGDAGQTTAEYALVVLGAAAIALLVLAWATQTSGVGRLLDAIIESVISRVT